MKWNFSNIKFAPIPVKS